MIEPAVTVDSERSKRVPSPWARKRRRLLKAFAIVALLLLPAIIWRARVSHETREMLRAQAAAERPVTLAQLNERNPSVPAGENAATVILEALSLYQEPPLPLRQQVPFTGRKGLPPESALSKEALDGTATWRAMNGETLKRLHAAIALPRSKYLSPYRPAGYNDFSMLRRLPELSELCCADAVCRAEQGDEKGASDALLTALAIPRSMAREGLAELQAVQWQMESQVLDALQFVMGRVCLADDTLNAFAAWFSPERRRAEISEMVSVEQCLFLARLREGYRRGMARNLLIASGVGDMNASAHMKLMGAIFLWLQATPGERPAIEAGYGATVRDAQKRPLLYLTLNVSPPPGYWDRYRSALDEAALARVGLALYAYHRQHGCFPDALTALALSPEEGGFELPSTGETMGYRQDTRRAELFNGSQDFKSGSEEGLGATAGEGRASSPVSLRFVVSTPP